MEITSKNELSAVREYVDGKYKTHLVEHNEEGGFVAPIRRNGNSSEAYGMLVENGKNSRFLPHRLKDLEETFVKDGGNGNMLVWAYDLKSGRVKVELVTKDHPVTIKSGSVQAEFMVPPQRKTGSDSDIEDEFTLVIMTVKPPYRDDLNESWVHREDELLEKLGAKDREAFIKALDGDLEDLLKMIVR